MSNIDKLKKKAAEFENKKQYEKPLELYEQILNHTRAGEEDREVPLYNKVGGLHYRIGNNEQAIGYYEKAADLYAEGGFFNNAIALCNKILRYAPGRTVIYYKLGSSARKKASIATPTRISSSTQTGCSASERWTRHSVRSRSFADLCPGQGDVRLMLAEQLARADRKPEALEQLQLLYETLESEGRTVEATAAVDRMKVIDPSFLPTRSATPPQRKKDDLVFLDLDFNTAELGAPATDAAIGEAMGAGTSSDAGVIPEGFVQAEPAAETEESEHTAATAVPERQVEAAAPSAPEGLGMTSVERERIAAITPLSVQSIDEEVYSAPSPAAASDLVYILPDVENPALANESRTWEDSSDADPVGGDHKMQLEAELLHLELAPIIDSVDFPTAEKTANRTGRQGTNGLPDDDFVDLGDWLERNRTPASTRMVAHDQEPEDNEQKDFGEMLDKFKEGISRNVDNADFESHYDLGIAFREMGLLDEAIGSFQKASRGEAQRLRASEAMWQCFIDKDEPAVATAVLQGLARDSQMGDCQLVGVLYLLGRAAEALGRLEEAESYYHRVIAVHIRFRDASARLSALAQTSR
ncbi:MAG: tetratricopeptide repeat protein [Gemmatimonadaceae bacterium]